MQGQGQAVQSLSATLALLCSPQFTAEIGRDQGSGLGDGLVEAVISGGAPVVGLRHIHMVCGSPLQRASFELQDFFADEPFAEEPADSGQQPPKRQCTGGPDGNHSRMFNANAPTCLTVLLSATRPRHCFHSSHLCHWQYDGSLKVIGRLHAGTEGEQAELMSVDEYKRGWEEPGLFHCPLCNAECTQYGAGMYINLRLSFKNGKDRQSQPL